MHLALHISGVSRYVHESYTNMQKNIITPCQKLGVTVHVFIHTWDMNGLVDDKWGLNASRREDDFKNVEAWNLANKNLSPHVMAYGLMHYVSKAQILVEDHPRVAIELGKILKKLPKPESHVSPINTLSALYSKYKCLEMQKMYEEKYSINFDVVMRYRTEILLEEELTQAVLDQAKNGLLIPKTNSKHGLNDVLALGPPSIMDIYNSSYTRVTKLATKSNNFNPHSMLQLDLSSHKIKYNTFNIPFTIGMRGTRKPKQIAVITPVSHLNGVKEMLESSGDVVFREEASKEEVRDILFEYNIDTILCNPNQQTYKIDKELLDNTSVKLINTCSTGMNHIDVDYCNKNGITVYSLTKDMYLIDDLPSTSELAFGLMMSLLRKIPQGQTHVSKYEWDYTQFMGRQVKDLKVGIIGYGRLGKMMTHFCRAFGAEVLICDPYNNEHTHSLEQVFTECDVLSLHVHVTDETKYMINKKLLGSMKKNSYIVNTSRGEIVNEHDIITALKAGELGGYATDVIEDEFNTLTESPIIKAMNEGENIIITPHVGGMTIEGQTKAYKWAIEKFQL